MGSINSDDFSIGGVRLGQSIESLQHLEGTVGKKRVRASSRLEEWNWIIGEPNFNPHYIRFVDRRVSHISGIEFQFKEIKFGSRASKKEVQQCFPIFVTYPEMPNHLWIEENSFYLHIGFDRRCNTYILSHRRLEYIWATE